MDVTLCKLSKKGGTSHSDLPKNHKSIENVKNAKDIYSVIWCILARLHPAKTFFSLTSSCLRNFIIININGLNHDTRLQTKDTPKKLYLIFFNFTRFGDR